MDFNKEDIKTEISLFVSANGLRFNEVVLGLGATLVFLGVRETCNKISLAVKSDRFKHFTEQGYPKRTTMTGECLDYNRYICIHQVQPSDVIEKEQFKILSPQYALSCKIRLQGNLRRSEQDRICDLQDIVALEEMTTVH